MDQRGREKSEGKRVESEIEAKREAVSKGEGESCSVGQVQQDSGEQRRWREGAGREGKGRE